MYKSVYVLCISLFMYYEKSVYVLCISLYMYYV